MPRKWDRGIGSDAPRLRRDLRKLNYEAVGIFNTAEQPLAEPITEGEEGEVPIIAAWAPHLRGSTLIHNHPNGTGPSRKDLDVFAKYGIAKMEIVTRHGIFALTNNGVPWTEPESARALAIWYEVNAQVQSEFRSNRLTIHTCGAWGSVQLANRLSQEGFVRLRAMDILDVLDDRSEALQMHLAGLDVFLTIEECDMIVKTLNPGVKLGTVAQIYARGFAKGRSGDRPTTSSLTIRKTVRSASGRTVHASSVSTYHVSMVRNSEWRKKGAPIISVSRVKATTTERNITG